VLYSDGLPDARPDLPLDPAGVAAHLADAVDVEAKLERLSAVATAGPGLPDDLTLVLVGRLEESGAGTVPEKHVTAH
jgi:hypothetical protein